MPETPTVLTLVVVEETQFRKLEAAAKARSEPNRVVKGLLDELDLAHEGSDKLGNVAHTLMIQRDAAIDDRDAYCNALLYRVKCVDELHVEVESLKEDRDMWRRAYDEAVKRRPATSWTGPLYGPGFAAPPLPPFPAMFYTRDATAVPNASAAQSFPNETATNDFEDRNRK